MAFNQLNAAGYSIGDYVASITCPGGMYRSKKNFWCEWREGHHYETIKKIYT